jgi:hypothetical protein
MAMEYIRDDDKEQKEFYEDVAPGMGGDELPDDKDGNGIDDGEEVPSAGKLDDLEEDEELGNKGSL